MFKKLSFILLFGSCLFANDVENTKNNYFEIESNYKNQIEIENDVYLVLMTTIGKFNNQDDLYENTKEFLSKINQKICEVNNVKTQTIYKINKQYEETKQVNYYSYIANIKCIIHSGKKYRLN